MLLPRIHSIPSPADLSSPLFPILQSIVVALHTTTRRTCFASSKSLAVRYRCLVSAAGLVPVSSTTCSSSAGPSKPRTTRTCIRVLRQVRLKPVGDACRSFARHVPRNPYPYPLHSNPTPHQIFHLPKSATKEDVKARCECDCFFIYFHMDVLSYIYIHSFAFLADCIPLKDGLPSSHLSILIYPFSSSIHLCNILHQQYTDAHFCLSDLFHNCNDLH